MQKTIKCPICNRRIFDVADYTTGIIEIKCPHCKSIVSVKIRNLSGHTQEAVMRTK